MQLIAINRLTALKTICF